MIGVESKATANRYQTHPLREAISGLGTMAPERYVDVVSKAQEQFLARLPQIASEQSNSELAGRSDRLDDMPQLAAPTALGMESSNGANAGYGGRGRVGDDVQRSNGAARLTQIVSDLMKLIGRGSLDELEKNAKLWHALSDAAKEQLENVSRAYKRAAQDAADAVAAAKDAADIAERARHEADAADKSAEEAKEQLDRAGNNHAPQAELDRLKAEWEKARDVAKRADNTAHAAASRAEAAKQQAVDASNSAADAESAVDSAVINAQTRLGSGSLAHIGLARPPLCGAAALTAIFAELQELISKGNLEELTANQKLFQEMQTRRLEQLQKKSEEYEKQVKKAEAMQKVMGCVGKILGWVVVAVSVVAVPFTSGASLALAAVGLALVVADQVTEAVTGFSFMGELVNPVMDRVLKPIMSFIAGAITRALESCGVESDKAQTAGAIVGAVLASIAVVAVVVASFLLAKGGASNLTRVVASQLAKLMDSWLGRIVIQTVESALEKSGLNALSSTISTVMGRLRRAIGEGLTNRIQRGGVGLYMGGQMLQAAGNIVVGVEERRAMNTLAAVKEALADLNIIGDALDRAVETFARHNRILSEILQNMSNALATETLTGAFILRNARAV
ncbi:Translocator protein BipB [Paraburkholderia ribeironis]|uniref:Translocator protein BipB n=1 Tax=Paraburkholderia ribeironis TaxID=1247936 RepID=A0A1N7SC18_9BURK|nr:type III secretion system translocon subunit SctE [Paraburkholderia ribeironis]SIT44965.1 Translocator protein BipB [Paraburkholderia ribeironis]